MDTLVVKDFDTAIDALIKKFHDPSFEDISFSVPADGSESVPGNS